MEFTSKVKLLEYIKHIIIIWPGSQIPRKINLSWMPKVLHIFNAKNANNNIWCQIYCCMNCQKILLNAKNTKKFIKFQKARSSKRISYDQNWNNYFIRWICYYNNLIVHGMLKHLTLVAHRQLDYSFFQKGVIPEKNLLFFVLLLFVSK
jgi:hypothetical protein